jgi:glycerol-3-phosphate dehydrogenase
MNTDQTSIKSKISNLISSSTYKKPHTRHITPKNILVLGAGSFGTACACLFARGNPLNNVVIYDYKDSRVDCINLNKKNPDYLSNINLPDNLTATTDPIKAFNVDVDFIFHSIPVQGSFEYLQNVKQYIDNVVEMKKSDYFERIQKLKQHSKSGMESHLFGDEKCDKNDQHCPAISPLNPNDLQFIRPLVLICMSKGIHMQKLQCMHEIIDDIFGLHELHAISPTPDQNEMETQMGKNFRAMINMEKEILERNENDNKDDELVRLEKLNNRLQVMELMGLIRDEFGNHEGQDERNGLGKYDVIDDKGNKNRGKNKTPNQDSLNLHLKTSPEITMENIDTMSSLFSPPPSLQTSPSSILPPQNTSNHHHSNRPILIDTQSPSFIYTCYLSGPSFAMEIATKEPTGFTIASQSPPIATLVAETISQDRTTVCTTTSDIWGVEISGALKNVYAIGAGIIEGLGFQWNTKALYITRASNEIRRIGFLLYRDKVDRATFSTLAGIGDLLLSCLGPSRNKNVGVELSKGSSLEDIKSKAKELAEGVPTTHAVYTILQRDGFVKYCPILQLIWKVLYEGLGVEKATLYLLSLPVMEEGL